MKENIINHTIPLESDTQKEDNTKIILTGIGIAVVILLVIWLVRQNKQGKAIIILAEMLPLIEL